MPGLESKQKLPYGITHSLFQSSSSANGVDESSTLDWTVPATGKARATPTKRNTCDFCHARKRKCDKQVPRCRCEWGGSVSFAAVLRVGHVLP